MSTVDDGLQSFEIDNTIHLLVDPMPAASGVAIGLWFRTGSAYERENEAGLSHFVEHMVFKGAGDRDAKELSRAFDRIGGYLNAFTERDVVSFHCLVPAGHAELALGILLDMAYRPRFEKSDFDREKGIITNEILSAEDDLEESAQDEFFSIVYDGHPAAKKIAGTVEDIEAATFPALCSFHEERFASGSMLVSVAGNVHPSKIAEQVAAAVPGARRPKTVDSARPVFRFCRNMKKGNGSQIYFVTGLPVDCDMSMDDFWNFSVISSCYGESMSSRLFMKLREEKGLCYTVSSAVNVTSMSGLWGVSSSTTPEMFPAFAETYRELSGTLYSGGLTVTEIEEAISRMRGMLSLAGDDPEYRMKRLARQFLYDGSVEAFEQTLQRFDCTRLDDMSCPVNIDRVHSLVRRYLDPARESIVLYGKIDRAAAAAARRVFGAAMTSR